MNEFQRYWQEKLRSCLGEKGTLKTLEMIENSDLSEPFFSLKMLPRLEEELNTEIVASVLMFCSCEYPIGKLKPIREEYRRSQNLKNVWQMLQDNFNRFLEKELELETDSIKEIQERHWGLAGKLEKEHIIAAKIPKSNYIREYFASTDQEEKRKLYCHCPRIRDMIGKADLDPLLCWCGAGFYKKIWEFILEKPVKITILNSILRGDEFCRFLIQL